MRDIMLACRHCGNIPRKERYHGGVEVWCDNIDCHPPCSIWRTDKDMAKAIKSWNEIYGVKNGSVEINTKKNA